MKELSLSAPQQAPFVMQIKLDIKHITQSKLLFGVSITWERKAVVTASCSSNKYYSSNKYIVWPKQIFFSNYLFIIIAVIVAVIRAFFEKCAFSIVDFCFFHRKSKCWEQDSRRRRYSSKCWELDWEKPAHSYSWPDWKKRMHSWKSNLLRLSDYRKGELFLKGIPSSYQ